MLPALAGPVKQGPLSPAAMHHSEVLRATQRAAFYDRILAGVTIAVLAAVMGTVVLGLTRNGADDFLLFAASLFLGSGVWLLALDWASVAQSKVDQARKNEALRSDGRPFYLLLRSFHRNRAYNRVETWNVSREDPLEPPITHYDVTESAVDLLLKAIGGSAALVLIGNPARWHLEPEGTVILLADEARWKQEVELLAVHSRAILVLPEGTDGLLEEIELLQAGLYQKTIVLMPPLHLEEYSRAFGMEGDDWNRIRRTLSRHVAPLPPPSETGLMFTVNRDFSVREGVPLSRELKEWGLAAALDTLVPTARGESRPLQDIYPQIEHLLPPLSYGPQDVTSLKIGAALAFFIGFLPGIITLLHLLAD